MEVGKITVLLDQRWDLEDLSIFSKEYLQLYSIFYILESVNSDSDSSIDFSTYPWRGGYSVVNFFRRSYGQIPKDHRPRVKEIRYASPGFIDLIGVLEVASQVATFIGTLCGSVYAINRTYSTIMKGYNERKLGKIAVKEAESKLLRDDIRFIRESILDLSRNFSLSKRQMESLAKISNDQELVQLKVLLALFRRAEPVVEQQQGGKSRLIPPRQSDTEQ